MITRITLQQKELIPVDEEKAKNLNYHPLIRVNPLLYYREVQKLHHTQFAKLQYSFLIFFI